MARDLLLASNLLGYKNITHDHPIASHIPISWLYRTPSLLVWAGAVHIVHTDFDSLCDDQRLEGPDRESVGIFMRGLLDEGVVHLIDPDPLLPDIAIDSITDQVARDRARFGLAEDEMPCETAGKTDQVNICVGGEHYCPVMLHGIYGTLLVSRFLNASSVFEDFQLKFCADRFRDACPPTESGQVVRSIQRV